MKRNVIIFLLICIVALAIASVYLMKPQNDKVSVDEVIKVEKTEIPKAKPEKIKKSKTVVDKGPVEKPVIINPKKPKEPNAVVKYLAKKEEQRQKDLDDDAVDEGPVENPVIIKDGVEVQIEEPDSDMDTDDPGPVENPEIEM